jgi:hypothetical protein
LNMYLGWNFGKSKIMFKNLQICAEPHLAKNDCLEYITNLSKSAGTWLTITNVKYKALYVLLSLCAYYSFFQTFSKFSVSKLLFERGGT